MGAEYVRGLMQFTDATVDALIARQVVNRPDRPAIMTSNGVLTYKALNEQIEAFSAGLRNNGIRRSDTDAIMLPDGADLAIAIVATICHAVAVPLNPKLTTTELDELFAALPIAAFVLSDRLDSGGREVAARDGVRLLEVSCGRPGGLKICNSAATASVPSAGESRVSREVDSDTTAIILRTSATTGRPKLVPLTHRNLRVTADKRASLFNLTADDRALCATPLYYSQALKGTLLTSLLVGGSVAVPDPAVDRDVLRWVTDLQPTWIAAGPTFLVNLLERALARQQPLEHCLRFIRSGAAPLPLAVRQGLEQVFGVPVLEGYGLTETGTVAANSIAPEHRKSGTMGRALPHQVAIRGEDGRLLPPGAVGEIVVRGSGVMPGYLCNDEANRAAFVDGWFLTGDLGSIDTEGYLTYLGRCKEFINRGGEKISLYEIERALLLHASIRDAAAFSVPHPRLGEVVGAAVVLMTGATTTEKEIKSFLANHLTPFKIPQRVFVMSEIPKAANGKTLKLQLSQMVVDRVREIAPPESAHQVQILEIWQRLLGRADIGIDDDFFEAGGDSLLAVEMMTEIEAILGQRVPSSTLRSISTIRELAAAIAVSPPATSEFLKRIKNGRGTPFIFCHDDTGAVVQLAEMLTCKQPVYHLHLHPNANLTIEEMARSYLPQVVALQPTGAFRFGGHCKGGFFAWEIAHQLTRIGREVEAVILVESISINGRPSFRAMAKLLNFVATITPTKISERLRADGMRTVWRTVKRTWTVCRKGKFSISGSSGPYSRAMANYLPPKIRSPVLCVLCEQSTSPGKSPTPWSRLAPKVHCDWVSGTHMGCITNGELARSLNMFFDDLNVQGTTSAPYHRIG